MIPSTTALTLNMQLPNIATVSWAVQGDQLARHITATLVDGSTPWTPEASYHGVIRYHKPDGTKGVYDVDEEGNPAVTWSGNVATITIAQQALTFPGTVLMQLEFYDSGDARITAFGWANNVQPSAVTDTEFLSTDYYNLLTLQIAGVLGASGHPPYINSTSENWMVWDESTASYVDSGFSSVGLTGPAPTVTGTAYQYANSSSGTVVPTSWNDTRPATTPGTWAWTKTVITFNTGSTTTLYSAAYQGQDGQGAPGSATPLPGDTNGTVGTATAYSREDHRHPLPVANDIKLENGTSVQVAIDYLPTWRGKRALIIGDSWLAGWNGSENITPWSSKFISLTGIVPDIVVLSGGGFTLNGTGTYTSESFVSCLDQVKDNKYDLIIVQGGVNDIVTGTASISDAIESFRTKCNTYFPNVPVYYIPTTPFYMLGSDQNGRALSLMRYAIENGLITANESAMFSFFRTSYKGTDLYHPSQTGMDRLGTYIASFINCGVFPKEFTQISAWSSYASYVKDVSFNSNVTNGTQYTRLYGEIVNVSASFTGASSQSGGWLTVMSGLPIPCIDYQSGLAFINGSGGTTTIPVYVNNGELILDLGTSNNINGKSVDVRMTYTTKSV